MRDARGGGGGGGGGGRAGGRPVLRRRGDGMFKNTFQSGFLSILYSIGSKPLQIWDKKVPGLADLAWARPPPCFARLG